MGLLKKIIGGAIGWSLGGPIGAIIGVAVTSAFENEPTKQKQYSQQKNNTVDDIETSLLVLAAYLVKIDKKVYHSEMNFVKDFLVNLYGLTKGENSYRIFEEIIKKQNIDIQKIAIQITQNTNHSTRLQLIHFMFGIANADGAICEEERSAIEFIASYFRISEKDFKSIEAMFGNSVDSAYKVLEITQNATNEEVKKAYRILARKHHPDKVQHLGEEYIKASKEKFQAIQNAFDIICKNRGI